MMNNTTIIEPESLKRGPQSIEINQTNVCSGLMMKERKLLNNPNFWHKIIVHNVERVSRDFMLKTILDDVFPADLIPVYFYMENTNAVFFARNCRQAIEKLCGQNLLVQNPQCMDKPFKLEIILGYSNTSELIVNVQDNINIVLTKRFQANTKMLNLDNFYKDPDLKEFCPLSQPKILYFVLHLSKQYAIQSLKLSNNDIHLLSPIESIWGMKSLAVLDLRNNLIEKMSELNILKTMRITELFLDGNPVCDTYDEFSYIQAVREVCPLIEKLDGVILGQKGFLPFRRNYLCKIEGQELIDQFLEHYFTLFDNRSRLGLTELYAKDALFSLTSNYLQGQSSSASANLAQYIRSSRNLKTLSDLSKNHEHLSVGGSNILKALLRLPITEHDPYSFTVDLTFYSVKICIATITGVFREPSGSLLESDKILGFSRTFVLRSLDNTEYHIINDQLHISNATSAQQQRAFKMVRVPRTLQVKVEVPTSPSGMKEMVEAFQTITTLNMEWSKKYMEEFKYDISKALQSFVERHKIDKIPEQAFAV